MFKDSFSFAHFRNRLAHVEALPQLVLLGILSGLASGLVIIAFRLLIDLPLEAWLPGGQSENFEALPVWMRVLLPITGTAVLALMFWKLLPATRKVGVLHVMERLSYHQGNLPAKNMLVQFFGGAIALLTGHSVGREGPAVHLGAACGSLVGQVLRLPNNSLRILVGCGVAAAISAAFNTPLAGVIFSMEVILMEYTVIGFTPVLVASVTAALLLRFVYGDESAFTIPALQIQSMAELPFVILLGVVCALVAAAFISIMLQTQKSVTWPLGVKLLVAGVLTGIVAISYPQVMGLGYDTLSEVLQGHMGLALLAGLLIAKGLLTPVVLGLGVPGGLIGPTLYIGAVTGATFALLVAYVTGANHSGVGFYAMLGMGAMMAAVLNAPLAALIALLELTANPNIIFPGMITIVVASTTVRFFFQQPSIFLNLLNAQGLDYRQEPLTQALSRQGVTSVMSSHFIRSDIMINCESAVQILEQQPEWLILEDSKELPRYILLPISLKQFIEQETEQNGFNPSLELTLTEVPAIRKDIVAIGINATLKEALDRMNQQRVDALWIQNYSKEIAGILTREQVEHFYTQKIES
ncbi:chloride channel protein [Amphritea sp. 2_MG-2023]|uniref:chloride channel protein n=1 Tax=Amphritea TaxID=515417 RepID=UPI001C06D677|nr:MULTISPECIES: chloride channel protein [Amphritea]MBU2966886.1 chloride channel protein [Amphritea atlantica]MDO6420102.1 chloride channel protein [Amphritea sp. 2_MG-2023]